MIDFLFFVLGTFTVGCIFGIGYYAGSTLGAFATRQEKTLRFPNISIDHTHGGDADV